MVKAAAQRHPHLEFRQAAAERLELAAEHPELDIKVLVQRGTGKGDAVRLGFEHAGGDLLMILDADLSVAPEDLREFYQAMVSGAGSSSWARASSTPWIRRPCDFSTSSVTGSSASF
jgi:glycosyltransferase involved in cell wall biosynthesis